MRATVALNVKADGLSTLLIPHAPTAVLPGARAKNTRRRTGRDCSDEIEPHPHRSFPGVGIYGPLTTLNI